MSSLGISVMSHGHLYLFTPYTNLLLQSTGVDIYIVSLLYSVQNIFEGESHLK
jgi:hypothetical protein